MSDVIPGLKLIRHTTGLNEPDDPSFPFKLKVYLSPPKLMEMTFVLFFGGSEEIVVRAMTKEAIYRLVELNDFRTHPRLYHLTITGPGGIVEQINGRLR